MWQDCYYLHFTDRETEAPQREETCLIAYAKSIRGQEIKPKSPSRLVLFFAGIFSLHFIFYLFTFKQASVFIDCGMPSARLKSILRSRSLRGVHILNITPWST